MTTKEINLKTINNESIIGRGNITAGGGTADIVTSWESTLSDTKVPSEKLTKNTIDGKADSVHTHTKSQITDFPTLATVATSGSYTDLSNKPSIPSSSSDLSDGSDIIKKSNTSGLLKNDGTIDTTDYIEETDLTLFCNAIREAYTTYEIIPSSSEITTDESQITLNATLKANGTPISNKTIELYASSTLIDSDTTDNDGEVNFTVELATGTTNYVFKYNDTVTATCTVTRNIILFYDPCNPSTHLNDYILGAHITLTQQTDYVSATHTRGNTEFLGLPVTAESSADWDYTWEHSSYNQNTTPYYFALQDGSDTRRQYYASINTTNNIITLKFSGTAETYDLSDYTFADGSIIKVTKRGTTYSLYIDDVLVASQSKTFSNTLGFYMGIMNSNPRPIALVNLKLVQIV